MKLCYDTIGINECEFIIESNESGKGIRKIRGPFLQGDVKNGNRRVYPFDSVLKVAVEEYDREYIKKNKSLGELEHPESPEISMERACILIEKFEKSGKNYIGTAKILDTLPMGIILSGLVDANVQVGVSSRGVGSLESASDARKFGYGSDVNVVKTYKLVAEDVVYNPSGPDCYVDGIVESKDYVLNSSGMIVEANSNAYDELMTDLSRLPKTDRKRLDEYKLLKIDKFLKSIRNS